MKWHSRYYEKNIRLQNMIIIILDLVLNHILVDKIILVDKM